MAEPCCSRCPSRQGCTNNQEHDANQSPSHSVCASVAVDPGLRFGSVSRCLETRRREGGDVEPRGHRTLQRIPRRHRRGGCGPGRLPPPGRPDGQHRTRQRSHHLAQPRVAVAEPIRRGLEPDAGAVGRLGHTPRSQPFGPRQADALFRVSRHHPADRAGGCPRSLRCAALPPPGAARRRQLCAAQIRVGANPVALQGGRGPRRRPGTSQRAAGAGRVEPDHRNREPARRDSALSTHRRRVAAEADARVSTVVGRRADERRRGGGHLDTPKPRRQCQR